MPADCLVKVGKRNLDDTEAEILCDKENLDKEKFTASYCRKIPLPRPEEILYARRESQCGWNQVLVNDLMEIPKKPPNKTQIDEHLLLFWCSEL